MLRRIRGAGGRRGGDAGIATSTLVMGMAVLLSAGLLLVGRIAQAGDMFTRSQTGADAAAIGALAPLRDESVKLLLNAVNPTGVGYWNVATDPEVPARKYAEENTTKLVGKVHLTGVTGDTAKVRVRTKECQLKREEELTAKEKEDLRNRRNLCTDAEGKTGIGRFGRATAIAKMIPPTCEFIYGPVAAQRGDPGMPDAVICTGNGRTATVYPGGSFDTVRKLFKIRLVDQESPISYTGVPAGPAGGTGEVVNHCAKDKTKTPTDDMSFGQRVVAWAMCWQGTPYSWGGGNASGPTLGICCSPGGHDARNTLGFDCSGLTLYAIYQASRGKILLGHYTGNQVSDPRGTPVPTNQLRPGDLIFYGTMPTHHVAIYAGRQGGRDMMVEAPQTGDVVKLTTLRAPDYARRFHG